MSDSEGESRTATVGRKRKLDGKLLDSYTVTPAASSPASSSDSESKESGEISSSSSESRHSKRQRQHSQRGDSDQDSDSSSGSSETESSPETDDSDDEHPVHSMASPRGQQSHTDSRANGNQGDDPNADYRLRVKHLSEQDQDEQDFYFYRDDSARNNDLVICTCCGEKGHIAAGCPARTCEHCGAYDEHISRFCPQYRKCGKCRKRGHDSDACPDPTRHRGPDPCDVCGDEGHKEDECVKLWYTSQEPFEIPEEKRVREMVKACYNCGACGDRAHWGDDCPYLDKEAVDGLGEQIKTWSAKHADQFINHSAQDEEDGAHKRKKVKYDDESGDALSEEGEVEELPPPPARNWQLAMLDDARD